MEILYAPTFREQRDTIHANCQCGYDIQILETLCNIQNSLKATKTHKILYLPHPKTPKNYHAIILNALKSPPPRDNHIKP